MHAPALRRADHRRRRPLGRAMADGLVGWYPDPGGTDGRYRYWDGSQWSAETTDDPRRPPPGAAAPAPPNRGRRGPLVAAALAGAVVLVLLGLVVRGVVAGAGPIELDPAPPTVVGGNDASPTPTPAPSPSARTPSASLPSAAPPGTCPLGVPNLRARHPVDDRVHGGSLSFPVEPTFRPAAEEPRFVFAYDVAQQTLPVSAAPEWLAQLAVGQVRAASGFTRGARETAERVVQCTLSGVMYDPYDPVRTDRRSGPITVDGRTGWVVEVDVAVTAPGLAFPGDRTVFVVVPDGRDWSFFFGAVPIGDAGLGEVLNRTVAGLRVG